MFCSGRGFTDEGIGVSTEVKRHNFWRFAEYVRPYWKYLLLAVAGGIVKFTVPLLMPQVTRHLLDDVFLNEMMTSRQKIHELLFYAGGMMAIFVFIYAPFVYVRHLYADKASNRAVFNMRCDLYYRILRMSASFFHRNKSGAILTRLISDIALAQNLVGTAITNIWMDAIALVVILYFLLRIDMLTTVVALATFPVYLFFFRRFSREMRTVTRQLQDELSTMSSSAQERIAGSVVVHAFAQEHTERKRFECDSERLFSTNMRRVLIQSLNQSITGTLVGISPLIVICFGGYRVITGRHDGGRADRRDHVPGAAVPALAAVLGAERGLRQRDGGPGPHLRDHGREAGDRRCPGAVELPQIRGEVEFDRVSFSYNESCPVLHEVAFRVRPGERVALVGPSGSGKTTIVSLIPRFYDVQAGHIRIDGHDVREVTVKSLRRHIGMVLQDPILFSGSVRENILYGKPEATDEEVVAASRAANAYEFIMDLPDGFDSEVGERGCFLSGGQRQRITIARAFLKDPRILILDEATANLDPESEHLIQAAMKRLVVGRTTFIIAHRLSTIINADRILVLSAGQVVESGTHHELLANGGLYRDYHRKQFASAEAS